jgi:hypothetical protein
MMFMLRIGKGLPTMIADHRHFAVTLPQSKATMRILCTVAYLETIVSLPVQDLALHVTDSGRSRRYIPVP